MKKLGASAKGLIFSVLAAVVAFAVYYIYLKKKTITW
jgi:cell division protein FtsL